MSVKTAFSSWNQRIAPVFDVARQLVLVETESGRILSETEETFPADEMGAKVRILAGLRVNTLVCGAISRFLHGFVASYGITVVPFVAGDLREVIQAWIEDRLNDDFAMPGCCARNRRRIARMNGPGQNSSFTAGHGYDGTGPIPDPGHVGSGGRMEKPVLEADGSCMCSQCGHREMNHAGIPCLHLRCPRCGSMMIRVA